MRIDLLGNTWETKIRKPANPRKRLKMTKYDPKKGSLGFNCGSVTDDPKKYKPMANRMKKQPMNIILKLKSNVTPFLTRVQFTYILCSNT